MYVGDVDFGDIFWSMLWFFFLFIWIMILLQVLTDLFRDHTLSGGAKAGWVVFLVFFPFLAVFVYLIARGKGMAERGLAQQRRSQAEFDEYVKSVSREGGTDLDQVAQAKQLLDSGAISQEEFDKVKAKVIG